MAQGDTYLTTEEAAAYLKLKPRKLYELASEGAVPCSKATGKWLFPRAALDRWVAAGLAMPAGLAPAEPPPIVGGSHDPLLEWALRRASAGLALLPEGSGAGLTRLARDEVMIAAIHLHAAAHAPDEDANAAAVRALPGLHDAVVIGFARREQGLVLAPDHAEGIDGVTAAARAGLRIGQRQAGAGAQALFERLCGQAGLAQDALRLVSRTYPTGNDLALAIRAGEIDGGSRPGRWRGFTGSRSGPSSGKRSISSCGGAPISSRRRRPCWPFCACRISPARPRLSVATSLGRRAPCGSTAELAGGRPTEPRKDPHRAQRQPRGTFRAAFVPGRWVAAVPTPATFARSARSVPDRTPRFAKPQEVFMSVLRTIAIVLLIVGGLNWGLVGLFDFDLVAALFGAGTPWRARSTSWWDLQPW